MARANDPATGLVRGLAAEARCIRDRLAEQLAGGGDADLAAVHAALAADLQRPLTPEDAADILAQALVCARPIVAACPVPAPPALTWLASQSSAWECWLIDRLAAPPPSPPLRVAPSPPLPLSLAAAAHLFDAFLHHYARDRRKRGGVFFTPRPIADYLVREVHASLVRDFGLVDGLASTELQILDPACGTGIFLLAVIDQVHTQFARRCPPAGGAPLEVAGQWNRLADKLLGRLLGIEILPAAAFLARLNIALRLAETGYDFSRRATIRILCADALEPATHARIANSASSSPGHIPVVIGNPPFGSLATSGNDWIARLVRGDSTVRGYVQADGQRLNERKTWLHDDYVKFIRLAQRYVEEAGSGIVGLITNHGYLDNATFRLMRSELLRVFRRVQIIDFHGSRKKHETAPDGGPDENVFGLDQGVAIGLFCRVQGEGFRVQGSGVCGEETGDRRQGAGGRRQETGGQSEICNLQSSGNFYHLDLWGSRESKLAALADPELGRRAVRIVPQPPEWRFVPGLEQELPPEYAAGWPLDEAMPLNATAPVTARDHFVIAFHVGELLERLHAFCDPSIADDEIRRRYFTRTRSARYPPGDTRSWKLSAARRRVAAEPDWSRFIVRCLYRPFDWRYVFWHPAMIDWPRDDVTRHLLHSPATTSDVHSSRFKVQGSEFKVQGSRLSERTWNFELGTRNYCLIARRQQLPTQPCNFFWISDTLALDGVIRSDNRGSESLFPLYCFDDSGQPRANFTLPLIEACAACTGLHWLPLGAGNLVETFGPEDLLAYLYALFFSPAYRQRYSDALRRGFPRVLMPEGRDPFVRFARWGHELMRLHLLAVSPPPLNPADLPPEVSAFRVGAYRVIRKWLQPPHRTDDDPAVGQIAAAISRTLEIQAEIDARFASRFGSASRGHSAKTPSRGCSAAR